MMIIITVNGTRKLLLSIDEITINSLDGISSEQIEVTGVDLPNFTTVERPSMKELKEMFKHTRIIDFTHVQATSTLFIL